MGEVRESTPIILLMESAHGENLDSGKDVYAL